MSIKISQSKLFNKISAEIIQDRKVIKYSHKKLFGFRSSEIPLDHINLQETQSSEFNSVYFLVSLVLIAVGCLCFIGCMKYFNLVDVSGLLHDASLNLTTLIITTIGAAFILSGILSMITVVADSGHMASFKSYVDHQPVLTFYCSEKYAADYMAFKGELLKTIIDMRNHKTIHDHVVNLDNDPLINIFPMLIVPEMKRRGFDVKSYIEFLLENNNKSKSDNNVVSLF